MSNIVTLQLKRPSTIQKFITYASFETEPTEANKAIATDLEVLHQELDSLFSTKMYERPYLPDYYNPLEEIIGDLWTETTATSAMHLVTQKVNQFIPRITVNNATDFTYKNYVIYMNLIFNFNNNLTKTLYNYEREFNVVT